MADQTRTRSGAMRLQQSMQTDMPTFLEAAPDALIAVGHDGCILLLNGRAETHFGYARDELERHRRSVRALRSTSR